MNAALAMIEAAAPKDEIEAVLGAQMACTHTFDVIGHERSELDYAGRAFQTPEEAYDTAELMAFDLVVKREDE